MSTATTVLTSVVVVLGTFALLGFVLLSAGTATAGESYAAFAPGAGHLFAPAQDSDAAPPPAEPAPLDADEAPPALAQRASPTTSTLGAAVTTFRTTFAAPLRSDNAPERALLRLTGGQTTAGVPATFAVSRDEEPTAGGASHRGELLPRCGRATSTALTGVQFTTTPALPLRLRPPAHGPSHSATGAPRERFGA